MITTLYYKDSITIEILFRLKCYINKQGNIFNVLYFINMLYNRATFLAGEMLCSPEHVPKFTALLCQITKGDFASRE